MRRHAFLVLWVGLFVTSIQLWAQKSPDKREARTQTRSASAGKPWPKICLTKGCIAQQLTLSVTGVAGAITMAKHGLGSSIQTYEANRKMCVLIESQFRSSPDASGYVPYSSMPPLVPLQEGERKVVRSMDKLFGADRSIPVQPDDVSLVAEIFRRIRSGPYRVTNFYWTIIPTKQVNSSSFPNPPFVMVYSSMFDFTGRNPDELAFVLAHEIGHTIDAHACSGTGMAQNAGLGIPIIANQFEKFCENHADNIGLQLMVGAGYDPQGAIRLLQKMEAYEKLHHGSVVVAFLGNHPLNASRIKNIEKILPIVFKRTEGTPAVLGTHFPAQETKPPTPGTRAAEPAPKGTVVVRRPAQSTTGREAPSLGVAGYASEYGLEITWVQPGSPAQQAGINAGDTIAKIDDRPVRNGQDIESAIAASTSGWINVAYWIQNGWLVEKEIKVR